MAIESTGTPVQFTLSGNSVTVPAETTAVFLLWQTYGNASGDKLYNFTLDGNSPDETFEFEGSANISGTGAAAFYSPATGSQVITYSTVNSIVTGPVIFVAFYKGVSLDGWRDADGEGTSGSTAISLTINTNTTDLVLRSEVKITSTPANETGWTSLQIGSYNSRYGRLTDCDSPGASTTTAEGQFENYSSVVVISVPELELHDSESEIGLNSAVDGYTETGVFSYGIGLNSVIDAESAYFFCNDGIGLNVGIDTSGNTLNVTSGSGFGTNGTADAYLATETLSLGVGMRSALDAAFQTKHIENEVGLNAAVACNREFLRSAGDQVGMNAEVDSYNLSQWIAANLERARKYLALTLTGGPDGLQDVEIPFSTFQARKRSDSQSYVSVVIRKFDFASQITDRQNGEIVIEAVYYVDGAESLRQEIIRAPIDTITIDQGPRNRAITLSGYKTVTYHQRSIELQNPIYKRLSAGKLQYRFADIDLFLQPTHELTVGEDTFTVGNISYFASNNQRQMDVFQVE